MKLKIAAALTLAAMAAACTAEPISQVPTDNVSITAAHIATIEGCRVYRFRDGGYDRYLTTCPGSVSARQTVSSGKTHSSRPDDIQTVVPFDVGGA